MASSSSVVVATGVDDYVDGEGRRAEAVPVVVAAVAAPGVVGGGDVAVEAVAGDWGGREGTETEVVVK